MNRVMSLKFRFLFDLWSYVDFLLVIIIIITVPSYLITYSIEHTVSDQSNRLNLLFNPFDLCHVRLAGKA